VRDAVKKSPHKDTPKPGKFRLPEGEAAEAAAPAKEGRDMELKITTLDARGGLGQPVDAIFGLEPRKDILQRCVKWQLASAAPAPTRSRTAPTSIAPARRPMPRRAPAARATARCAPTSFRGGGRSFGPVVRSMRSACQEGARARVAARALGQAKDGGIVLIDKATVDGGKTKASRRASPSSASQRVDHRRRGGRCRASSGGAQPAEYRRAADPGNQRLRHSARTKLVLTKAAVDALEARFK